MAETILLLGWGVETASFAAVAPPDDRLLLVGPPPPADIAPRVSYLGPVAPEGIEVDRVLRSPSFRPDDVAVAAVSTTTPITTPTGRWFETRPVPGRIVAITGSKAKSSTASLVDMGLGLCGVEHRVAGNIGASVWSIEASAATEDGVTVVELSSYQCHDLPAGADDAALTFLSADHLDWHGGLSKYHADKLRLVRLTSPRPCLTGDAATAEIAAGFGLPLTIAAAVDAAPRVQNSTLAAAVVGVLVGLDATDVRGLVESMLADYPVLPSRMQTIGHLGTCEVIDDALGSNPTATSAALRQVAGRRVAWIMGGARRGVALDPLVQPAAVVVASGGVVLAFGEAGATLRALLAAAGVGGVVEVASLEQGVENAVTSGSDVILFSPSGPTPPEEGTWKERSARFAAAVTRAGGDEWVPAH